jgi:hypothetical protein
VELVYDPKGLSGVMTVRPGVLGVGWPGVLGVGCQSSTSCKCQLNFRDFYNRYYSGNSA